MPRLDTRLESEGAEFLVLGNLLINRIAAYKAYANMPGYDLVATNAENHTSARIQIKSRWSTGATTFPIKNFDCDFVVAAFLNRGSKDQVKQVLAPEFYVFPVALISALPRSSDWSKVSVRGLPNLGSYKEAWHLIRAFLEQPVTIQPAGMPEVPAP
jgi:hypothetical protein